MKKRIFQIVLTCLVGLTLFSITACSEKNELDNLTDENVFSVSIESFDEENANTTYIEIYFYDGTLRRRTMPGSTSEEIVLTETQCKELRKYIAEYSHTVKEKEQEYWPQTSEYPEMLILFSYEICFDDNGHYKDYKESGALCYPDGWNDFIEYLLTY